MAELQHAVKRIDLYEENGRLGVMLSASAVTQLISNSLVGSITVRVGYTAPMLLGFALMFTSTLIFIFGTTYAWFFLARVIQGIGTSFSAVSGSGMLAERFSDDEERGIVLGRAQSGMGIGAAVGPIYGGMLYHHFGKSVPFIILAGVILIDGLLRLSIISIKSSSDNEDHENKKKLRRSFLFKFIQDPLMLIVVGTIMMAFIGIAAFEATLPIHMMLTMPSTTTFDQGLAFVPLAVGMGISQNTFGALSFRIGRWLCCIIGLGIAAFAFVITPWCHSLVSLLAPLFVIGFANGMITASAAPLLPHFAQLRHSSMDYGSVFALLDSGMCLSLILGNSVGGALVELIGFRWMCVTVASLQLLYTPLIYFLRSQESMKSPEEQLLIDNGQTTPIISNCTADHSQ